MHTKLTVLAAVLAVGAFASTAAAAPAASSCSDYGYRDQANLSVHQVGTALDFIEVESYSTAEAWALRGWRTMMQPQPCRGTYRRFRQYQINSAASVWRATRAYRSNNETAAYNYLGAAGRWLDKAGAEQATWP